MKPLSLEELKAKNNIEASAPKPSTKRTGSKRRRGYNEDIEDEDSVASGANIFASDANITNAPDSSNEPSDAKIHNAPDDSNDVSGAKYENAPDTTKLLSDAKNDIELPQIPFVERTLDFASDAKTENEPDDSKRLSDANNKNALDEEKGSLDAILQNAPDDENQPSDANIIASDANAEIAPDNQNASGAKPDQSGAKIFASDAKPTFASDAKSKLHPIKSTPEIDARIAMLGKIKKNELKIIKFLRPLAVPGRDYETSQVNRAQIHAATRIGLNSIKSSISRLVEKAVLSRGESRSGNDGWATYRFAKDAYLYFGKTAASGAKEGFASDAKSPVVVDSLNKSENSNPQTTTTPTDTAWCDQLLIPPEFMEEPEDITRKRFHGWARRNGVPSEFLHIIQESIDATVYNLERGKTYDSPFGLVTSTFLEHNLPVGRVGHHRFSALKAKRVIEGATREAESLKTPEEEAAELLEWEEWKKQNPLDDFEAPMDAR